MLQTRPVCTPMSKTEAKEGHYLSMKSGVSCEFDFGYVGFAVFESLESFEVCFVCWREYAAQVFNQVDLQYLPPPYRRSNRIKRTGNADWVATITDKTTDSV